MNVMVAGHKGNHNIAYFVEPIKPLVLNASNSRMMKAFNNMSPFVEDWSNTVVELYIKADVKMKGEVVGGVRIRSVQPSLEKNELKPGTAKWDEAIQYLQGGNSITGIEKSWKLSEENRELLLNSAI